MIYGYILEDFLWIKEYHMQAYIACLFFESEDFTIYFSLDGKLDSAGIS